MEIKQLVLGPVSTNCYLLKKEDTLIIVDPAASVRRIIAEIEQLGGQLNAILLTHGHFDHICAVDSLYKKYKCPVYVCKQEENLIRNAKLNFGYELKCPVCWLEEEKLQVGCFGIRVLYTPGHTAGSIMYVIDGSLFSGDTLFAGSIGRTDLYSGSSHQIMESLKVVYQLDPNMMVYPGHEQLTTVAQELKSNPYL